VCTDRLSRPFLLLTRPQFIAFIFTSLVTMTFLLSYDIRWTMKLLRRDLRDLRIKYMTSTKHKCGPVEIARSPSAYQQDQVENKPQVPEDVQYSGVLSECVSEGSVYSKAPQGSPETSSEKRPSTLYELMERRIRATYASRDRNMSHEDRWKFRGSWLLLYKAIQACPSNGSGNGFQYGAKETNDYIMLLDMLSQSTKKGRSSTSKVSKMPATPYTRHDNDHDRYDSMFSDGHIPHRHHLPHEFGFLFLRPPMMRRRLRQWPRS
jgi:hypothetical protein